VKENLWNEVQLMTTTFFHEKILRTALRTIRSNLTEINSNTAFSQNIHSIKEVTQPTRNAHKMDIHNTMIHLSCDKAASCGSAASSKTNTIRSIATLIVLHQEITNKLNHRSWNGQRSLTSHKIWSPITSKSSTEQSIMQKLVITRQHISVLGICTAQ